MKNPRKYTTHRTRHAIVAVLAATLWLAPTASYAQQDGVSYSWELKRDKDDIKIYTSPVAGSKYKAVRAVTKAQAKVSSAVALVLDVDACPEWAALCKKSKIMEALSPTKSYVYTLNDLPFPVADRDAVALVEWTVNPDSGRVTMTSTATDSQLVPVDKPIRLNQAVTQWHFQQLDTQTIQIESFAHIDPNGVTPAWVTNMLLVDSPYKTLKKMTTLLESGRYENAKVDFLN